MRAHPAPGRRFANTKSRQVACEVVTVLAVAALAAGTVARPADAANTRLADSIAYLNAHGAGLSMDTEATVAADRLRPLLVDEATLERTLGYLSDLRADDYGRRETASRELAKLRSPIDSLLAVPAPAGASAAGTLELTWRLQQILAVRRPLALEDRLYHALVVVGQKPVPGLIPELLTTARALEGGDTRLLDAAESAIGITVRANDRPLLEALAIPGSPRETRGRATAALARLLAGSDTDALAGLLANDDPGLRLAAARGAVIAGSSRGIPELVALLEDPSVTIRCRAFALLFQHTGEDFGYAGYDDAALRGRSVARWRQWLRDGTAAASATPLPETGESRVLVGIELMESPEVREGQRRGLLKPTPRSNVLEFTPSGSIRWHMRSRELRGGTAVAAIPLSGGARAIAFGKAGGTLQQNMSIRFFGSDGLPLGSLSGIAGIPVLGWNAPGNLMLAAAGEIIEVGVLGNVLRRAAFGGPGEPVDFFAAGHGGRVLVVSTEAGTAREYSGSGALLLEVGNLARPVYARRMRDGRLVVGQEAQGAPAIICFDPSGKPEWSFTPAQDAGSMTAVAALSNGNALLGSTTGLYEVGAGGRITRTWINGSVSFVYAD